MVAVKLQKEENRKAFLDVFPTLAEEVLAEMRKYNMPQDAYDWTKEVSSNHPCLDVISYSHLRVTPELVLQRSWRYISSGSFGGSLCDCGII